eukprot:gene33645-40700_t
MSLIAICFFFVVALFSNGSGLQRLATRLAARPLKLDKMGKPAWQPTKQPSIMQTASTADSPVVRMDPGFSRSSDLRDKAKEVDRLLGILRQGNNTATLNEVFKLYKLSLSQVNHAIMTAGKVGRLNSSIEIFSHLSNLGYLPDLMSYNSLIYACSHNRRIDLAEEYFKLLQNHKQPNVYSYAALMHGYARAKDTEGAKRTLEMMQREGVRPNSVVLTAGE